MVERTTATVLRWFVLSGVVVVTGSLRTKWTRVVVAERLEELLQCSGDVVQAVVTSEKDGGRTTAAMVGEEKD